MKFWGRKTLSTVLTIMLIFSAAFQNVCVATCDAAESTEIQSGENVSSGLEGTNTTEEDTNTGSNENLESENTNSESDDAEETGTDETGSEIADSENSDIAGSDSDGSDSDTSDSEDESTEELEGSDVTDDESITEKEDDESSQTSVTVSSSPAKMSIMASSGTITEYSYSYSYTSLNSATLSPTSVTVDDVLEAAAELIAANEGTYSSVNVDDNGALSIGIIQWHGANALMLMRLIISADNETAYEYLGSTLYNEIISSSTDWSSRTLTSSESTKISNCISSSKGQKIQDKLLNSYISGYINNATSYGIKNAAAIVFYADLENQRGKSGAKSTVTGAYTLAGSYSKITANEMLISSVYNYSSSVSSVYKAFANRRLSSYEYVSGLGWTYCSSGDYRIAYSSTAATSESSCVKWLQTTLNKINSAGLTVDGSWGSKTLAAVTSFQSDRGLDADGIPGTLTIRLMLIELYGYITTGSVSDSTSTTTTTTTSSTASTLKISSYNYPSSIKAGSSYSIKGTIKSNYSISKVTVKVLNSDGDTVLSASATPNAKSYSIANLDSKIKFGSLSVGTYTYKVTAKDTKGSKTLVKKSFKVTSLLKIKSYNYPTTLVKGNSYSIKGTISSSYKITKVTVKVINSSGKTVLSASATPNAKSYSIAKLDSKIKFGSLSAGTYTYKVTAKDTKGSKTLVKKSFKVTTLKIKSYNYPTSITKGSSYSIKGTITSSYKIKKVTVKVLNSSGETVLSASAKPNAKSYNIKKLDSKLKFGSLSKGTYTYRVAATDTKGSRVLVKKTFKVK